jgi:hypothetical protein
VRRHIRVETWVAEGVNEIDFVISLPLLSNASHLLVAYAVEQDLGAFAIRAYHSGRCSEMSRSSLHLLLLILPIAAGAPSIVHADPLADGDLVAVVSNFGGSPTTPNMALLDPTGDLEGWFFSPFSPADIAVDHAGQVLFGASSSGTVVSTDSIGSLVALIQTPAAHVNGLAVTRRGNLVVADENTFFRLSPSGQLIDMVISPVALPGGGYGGFGLGADGDYGVVFPIAPTSYDGLYSLGFLDLRSQVLTTVTTELASISALDVSASGDIVVVGSKQSYGDSSIYLLGRDGQILGQITGPKSIANIAVANVPEPSSTNAAEIALVAIALHARLRGAFSRSRGPV